MKFVVVLVALLVLSVIAGVVRKLRGGTFLPQPERDEDRIFMDKRSGRWWRQDPSGTVEEALRPSPEDRRAVGRSLMGSLIGFLVLLLVVWVIVLAIWAVLYLFGYSF